MIVLVASGIYGLQSARDTLALSAARAAFVMYSIVAGSTNFVLTEAGIADPRPVGPDALADDCHERRYSGLSRPGVASELSARSVAVVDFLHVTFLPRGVVRHYPDPR